MRRQDQNPPPRLVAESMDERSSSLPQTDVPRSLDSDNEKEKEVSVSKEKDNEVLGPVKDVVKRTSEEKRAASPTKEENKEAPGVVSEDNDAEVEDEEEGECGFCVFMKGGGCKDNFIAWEKCVEEAEKNKEDIAEKCFNVTGLLQKCMDAHADYYAPILRAEKAIVEEAERELGKDSNASADIGDGGKDAGQEASSTTPSVIEKK